MSWTITEHNRRVPKEIKPLEVVFEEIKAILRRRFTDARIGESAFSPNIYVTVERGWGCSVSLEIGTDLDRYADESGTHDVLAIKAAQISWPSTGHSTTTALCAVSLFREAIEAAAEIDTKYSDDIVLLPENNK